MDKNKETKKIKVREGYIRDYIDGKERKNTSEEYVRQNVEKRLINEHLYPKTKVQIEYNVKLGSKRKRVDIAVFAENATEFNQEDIYVIIECKKESVASTDKNEGIEQLKSYMSACPNCEWGMWTNGKEKEVFRKVEITDSNAQKKITYESYIDIPSFGKDISEIDRPTRSSLKQAVDDNMLFAFKKCHNHIYAMDGMQKQPAFFELLKLIFCKIEDEKNWHSEFPDFYAKMIEWSNPDGQLTIKKRIDKLFDRVKKKHSKIFDKSAELKLQARTVAYIVGELQKYSLLKTNIDVKGKAYEEIVGANLRGDRGEFFTPRNVMEMTVKMLNPKIGESVLDSSCGTGGFIVSAMNHVIEDIEAKAHLRFQTTHKNQWTAHQHRQVSDRIQETAKNYFFGFDINPDLVKATKMNMVMNNDGSGNILRCNSLLPPHEWSEKFKEALAIPFGLEAEAIKTYRNIGLFDVIVTNPPFGSKIPIKDTTILNQYEIARNRSSLPPEQLFVERCVQLLKPGGRLGVILPDSILSAPGLSHIRQWLLKNTQIIASIDLHADTFQPRNGTQTTVLVLQKKQADEIDDMIPNYDIFMAVLDKIGHDKRGNTIFERDNEGNILYKKVEKKDAFGNIVEETIPAVADQTLAVPELFAKWKKEEGIKW